MTVETTSDTISLQERYSDSAKEHLLIPDMLTIPELHPDSHKGRNGKLAVIGGSSLFHGAGQFAALGAWDIMTRFGSITNDAVYFCSTEQNVAALKNAHPSFMGIHQNELDEYLRSTDVIVIGPGLMREPQEGRPETEQEPIFTRETTQKALESGKKIVLDAGSLQVLTPSDLQAHPKMVITPHRKEMTNLFGIPIDALVTTQDMSFAKLQEVAQIVQEQAQTYDITILLKGPIDIIADRNRWLFSPGGNAGMTKGGTGDVLAGVVGSLYSRIDDPLLAAATGSYLMKRTGEALFQQFDDFYNAADMAAHVGATFEALRYELVKLKRHSPPSQKQSSQ